MTVAVALDKKLLWRDINREERKKKRELLADLRGQIREARARRKDALLAAKERCRSERIAARERARSLRLRALQELKEAVKAERAAARQTCSVKIGEARAIRDDIERARTKHAAEREYQRDLRRIEAANRQRRKEHPHATHIERRAESDDEIRMNISSDSLVRAEGDVARVGPPRIVKVFLRADDSKAISICLWRQALSLASENREIPLEHRLLISARRSVARRYCRRAVLDCATAAEITLTRALEDEFSRLGTRVAVGLFMMPTSTVTVPSMRFRTPRAARGRTARANVTAMMSCEHGFEIELAAAGVLHDVRAAMGIAKGLAQVAMDLIETGQVEEAKAMLERIDDAATKGAELCGDVLECARRNGVCEIDLAHVEIDLVTLAREQVALHSVAIRERGSAVDFFADQNCVLVRTHRRSLERVLSNLLQNAGRHGAGRPIDVHVSGNARGSVLIVRDRGIGIPRERLEQIFAPYHCNNEVDFCFERFGLGLWIVRHLVCSLGGTIHVASEHALGTAISVSLPSA